MFFNKECVQLLEWHVVQFPSVNFSELKSRKRKHYDVLPHPRNEKWPRLNVL